MADQQKFITQYPCFKLFWFNVGFLTNHIHKISHIRDATFQRQVYELAQCSQFCNNLYHAHIKHMIRTALEEPALYLAELSTKDSTRVNPSTWFSITVGLKLQIKYLYSNRSNRKENTGLLIYNIDKGSVYRLHFYIHIYIHTHECVRARVK